MRHQIPYGFGSNVILINQLQAKIAALTTLLLVEEFAMEF